MSFSISKTRSKRSKMRSRPAGQERATLRYSHVSGIAVAVLLWLVVMILLHGGKTVTYSSLAPGQRAPATVVAAVDFQCEDIGRTDLGRREAADAVPPVFTINTRPLNTAHRSLDKLFDRILRIRAGRQRGELSSEYFNTAINDVVDLLGLSLTPADVAQLAPVDEEEMVLEGIKSALAQVWAQGILSPEEASTAFHGAATRETVVIRTNKETLVGPIGIDALLLPSEALDETVALIRKTLPEQDLSRDLLTTLLTPWIVPNMLYDRTETEQSRGQARKRIEPVPMHLREGTVLVERGAVVTPQIVEQLRAHDLKLSALETETEHRLKMLGNGSILIMALVICAGLLRIVRPAIFDQRRFVILLALLSLLTLLPARGLLYLSTTTRVIPPGLVEFMTPLALAPLLGAILIGGATAIVLGLWTSFATAVLFGNSFPVFTMGLIATALAAFAARGVRRRARVFQAGLWVGVGEMIYAMGLAALNQPDASVFAWQVAASLASGLLCAGLALLLIPLFEVLFGITTDLRLLEFSDPGHPLLQRLAKEAPGTYHHSLMVADLSRAAAAEVGANELLCRVCAYFHDIGKLTKPEFFAENQQYSSNPHDHLEPSMSTLIIIAHVKEGVALAQQYKLPTPIHDGIRQHHGTSLISYFYHRAKQQHAAAQSKGSPSNGKKPNRSDFRYAGPRPQTREMGILLLADSIEAASRAMSKPSASKIEAMVTEIVDSRLQDHQLDESRLTLSDISAIKKSFIFSLNSMLHARIEYPQDENRNKQSTEPPRPAPEKGGGADTVDYGARATA